MKLSSIFLVFFIHNLLLSLFQIHLSNLMFLLMNIPWQFHRTFFNFHRVLMINLITFTVRLMFLQFHRTFDFNCYCLLMIDLITFTEQLVFVDVLFVGVLFLRMLDITSSFIQQIIIMLYVIIFSFNKIQM